MSEVHESHILQSSDSSHYDFYCTKCNMADRPWEYLSWPCPERELTRAEFAEWKKQMIGQEIGKILQEEFDIEIIGEIMRDEF